MIFQSTHPYRVRPGLINNNRAARRFQSTHPYRVRQPRLRTDMIHMYFNPRTRTGCDQINNQTYEVLWISIHAPVQGATTNPRPLRRPSEFQSTHPYRVRLVFIVEQPHRRHFNPRTRTGCDGSRAVLDHPFPISIHAPVQGATVHRSLSGHDHTFQSTHPYRVRQE